MATKSASTSEATETREEATEGLLLDSLAAAIKKMVARGKERGYVTYDELNAALPPEQVSSEQIEDTMTMLSELGVNVVESEEADEGEDEEGDGRAGNLDDEDIGRTDDPVRMYLREMGSVELLSREGEIAIAKRIEAGREMMIGGICESPLTIKAIVTWHDALIEGKMLLRDIIDLEATYGVTPVTGIPLPAAPGAPAKDGVVAAPVIVPKPQPPAPPVRAAVSNDSGDPEQPKQEGEQDAEDAESEEINLSLAMLEA